MHRTTLWRFSKKTGIAIEDLNEFLVAYLMDRDNLKHVYKDLEKFHNLTTEHKRAGMIDKQLSKLLRKIIETNTSFQEILNWLETKE